MSGIVPTNFKKNIWSEEHVYILSTVAEAMLLYIYINPYITGSETNTNPISNFVFDYIMLSVKVCCKYSLWHELGKIELQQRQWFIVKLGTGCICRNMFCHG